MEPDSGLRQNITVHATGVFPRLYSLFVIKADDIKALHVAISPVTARSHVTFNRLAQITGDRLELLVVKIVSEVRIEGSHVYLFNFFPKTYLNTAVFQLYHHGQVAFSNDINANHGIWLAHAFYHLVHALGHPV